MGQGPGAAGGSLGRRVPRRHQAGSRRAERSGDWCVRLCRERLLCAVSLLCLAIASHHSRAAADFSTETAKRWAEEQGFLHFETSARTGENIRAMFEAIGALMRCPVALTVQPRRCRWTSLGRQRRSRRAASSSGGSLARIRPMAAPARSRDLLYSDPANASTCIVQTTRSWLHADVTRDRHALDPSGCELPKQPRAPPSLPNQLRSDERSAHRRSACRSTTARRR